MISHNGNVPFQNPDPEDSLLNISNVWAGYDESTVLQGVDLSVPAGSVVCLFGANGAGKTTLLRTIAGLLRASKGHVTLDGRDVTSSSAHARASSGLCLIPEGRGIFRSLSVRENLELFGQLSSPDEAIAAAIEVFPDLGGRLSQTAGTMSGGQQQMLALSRAFICAPQIVLLDEVSMGLAPIIVDQLFESISLLARSGCSLLIVEQYAARALQVSDIAYILSRGQITHRALAKDLDEDTIAQHYID